MLREDLFLEVLKLKKLILNFVEYKKDPWDKIKFLILLLMMQELFVIHLQILMYLIL
jgi:hypothetical protein